MFSANIVDNLTNLFIYLILAIMWNALAGFAGLVSVGQQAFFGLGAYFAIQLSYHGLSVYPALLLGALIAGIVSLPISVLMLRLRGGEFAIGMWVVAELAHLFVALDPLINGETGVSMISLNAFSPDDRRAYNYWMALGSHGGAVWRRIRVAARPPWSFGAGDSRRRGRRGIASGVRVLAGKRTIFFLAAFGCALAGSLWLATSISFQPRQYFGIQWTAYMIFMVLVGGLGTFEGPIIGALIFFLIEISLRRNRRLVSRWPRRRGHCVRLVPASRPMGHRGRQILESGCFRSVTGCAYSTPRWKPKNKASERGTKRGRALLPLGRLC